MDRYTRLLFGVTCPYSGEKCETEIDCLDCLVEKEERRLHEEKQSIDWKEDNGQKRSGQVP
jgi:hypothetical protein